MTVNNIGKTKEIKENTPNSFIPSQFENQANPLIHQQTTAKEIWNDTDGRVDLFVAGVGTGGTVTGTGKYLKEKKPSIKVIGIEPADSAVLSGGCAGEHGLQGIGAGFVPEVLDTDVLEEFADHLSDELAHKVDDVEYLGGSLLFLLRLVGRFLCALLFFFLVALLFKLSNGESALLLGTKGCAYEHGEGDDDGGAS